MLAVESESMVAMLKEYDRLSFSTKMKMVRFGARFGLTGEQVHDHVVLRSAAHSMGTFTEDEVHQAVWEAKHGLT